LEDWNHWNNGISGIKGIYETIGIIGMNGTTVEVKSLVPLFSFESCIKTTQH